MFPWLYHRLSFAQITLSEVLWEDPHLISNQPVSNDIKRKSMNKYKKTKGVPYSYLMNYIKRPIWDTFCRMELNDWGYVSYTPGSPSGMTHVCILRGPRVHGSICFPSCWTLYTLSNISEDAGEDVDQLVDDPVPGIRWSDHHEKVSHWIIWSKMMWWKGNVYKRENCLGSPKCQNPHMCHNVSMPGDDCSDVVGTKRYICIYIYIYVCI